jgi:hypothetical protein
MQSPGRIRAASAGIGAYCGTGVETPLDRRWRFLPNPVRASSILGDGR